jgi:HEAT repeat protein
MTKPRVPAAKEGLPSERTGSETTALLVELGRAVKARSFYAASEPEVRLLFSRAWRSVQTDLRRFGALEIEAAPAWLRVPGLALRVPNVQLGGLPQRMADRGLRTLRFEKDLTSDAFGTLVDLLAGEPEDSAEAFADVLYRAAPRGFIVNGVPSLAAAVPAAATAPAEATASESPPVASLPFEPEIVTPAAGDTAPVLDESSLFADTQPAILPRDPAEAPLGIEPAPPLEPPAEPAPIPELSIAELSVPEPLAPRANRPSAPLDDLFDLGPEAFASRGGKSGPIVPPPPTIPIGFDGEEGEGDWSLGTGAAPTPTPSPLPRPAGPAARRADDFDATYFDTPGAEDTPIAEIGDPRQLALGVDPSDATPRTVADPDTDTETVEAERAAASAVALAEDDYETRDSRAEEVDALLRELGDCDDDFQYHDLARRAEILATALADEGRGEIGYRAMVLFARHAGDDGKRTPLQRDAAMDHLQRLASGMRLGELVDRACAPDTESSLEATQVLLRLGSVVVPMLFRAVEREADPNRRGQLHGILIAMGEAAMPELMRAFESREPVAVRAAARLAGELQSPKAVPPLAALLEGPDASMRQEAAKALVRIGDPRALDVLVRALDSSVSDVPNLAAFCLGAAGNGRAADALRNSLRRAVGRRRYEFATELARSLGRLGRQEAAGDLAAILAHRGLRFRAQWRDLKIAAAAALGRIPGDEAKAALTEAAKRGDAPVRRAAQSALDRRGR